MAGFFKRRIEAIEKRLGVGSDAILWTLPGCEPMTGKQIRALVRAIDGKTRGILEAEERSNMMA